MIEAVTLAPGFEEFAAVAKQMNYMINDLRSKEVLNLQHGDVEKMIAKNGNELCRRFLQSYFDGSTRGRVSCGSESFAVETIC